MARDAEKKEKEMARLKRQQDAAAVRDAARADRADAQRLENNSKVANKELPKLMSVLQKIDETSNVQHLLPQGAIDKITASKVSITAPFGHRAPCLPSVHEVPSRVESLLRKYAGVCIHACV